MKRIENHARVGRGPKQEIKAGDEDGIAILADEATKNVVRMKTGEKFSGWMLSSVGKRSATFQMARQVAVLAIPIP